MQPRRVLYELCLLLVVLFGSCLLCGEIGETPRHAGAAAQPSAKPAFSHAAPPLGFEINQGQTDKSVDFTAHGMRYGLFLTRDEMVLELQHRGVGSKESERRRRLLWPRAAFHRATYHGPRTTDNGQSSVLRLALLNANPDAWVNGADELPGKANYFIGNNPKRWRTNVPTYSRVRYHHVYPGIDLIYYGNQGGQLEYDFVVAPGANPGAITLGVRPEGDRNSKIENRNSAGRASPYIARDGDLIIPGAWGNVHMHSPIVYQEQEPGVRSQESEYQDEERKSKIENRNSTTEDQQPRTFNRQSTIVNRQFRQGRFVLDDRNHVRFAVGPYDRTRPLIIDPVLYYSTNLSGNLGGAEGGIAVDSSGSAYITGGTDSADFPTSNPLQANLQGQGNCFVSKLSPDGSELVYSTYLGGSDIDYCTGIAVDSSGNAYVTGETWSSDFPTVNSFQANSKTATPSSASATAFVSKLNSTGSALIYSTYLGGSTQDSGSGIAVDTSGSAYVTGTTFSSDFPTSAAFQATCNNCPSGDAFVTKFNPSGAALTYSTFLGGSSGSFANAIAVDTAGEAYVTGGTLSYDFPTANPLQANNHSSQGNAFVTKFNPAGSALLYSTYLGGSGRDVGAGIAVDSSSSAYLTGSTTSTDFPTRDPFQSSSNIYGAAFVSKLNPSGSALFYSTYLGGNTGSDSSTNVSNTGAGIAVDAAGDAYVTGATEAVDFPTVNAIQATCPDVSAGCGSAFVTEFDPAGTALVYSTYLGGSSYSEGYGIAVDSSGNADVTGENDATDFPGALPLPPAAAEAGQTFVAKIAGSPAPGPGITLSTRLLAFGNEPVGMTTSAETVMLRSVGAKPLTITNIGISGDFALVSTSSSCPYGGGTVASGAYCTIDINFTPTESGTRSGSIVVTDNAGGSPQNVSIAGVGLSSFPRAAVSPTTVTFAPQWANSISAAQVITLSNTGNAALAVPSIALTGLFNQSLYGVFYQTNDCGSSLPPGASCTINVTFNPGQGGTQSANLVITDDTDGHPNSTQSVGVSGMGQDFTLNWVSDSPAGGNLSVGQTGVYTFAVAATGGFNHSMAFSCSVTSYEAEITSSVQLNSTCTVSPASLTPTNTPANVAVTVLMTQASGSALNKPWAPRPNILALKYLLILAALWAPLMWRLRRRWPAGPRGLRTSLVLLAAGLLLAVGFAGCSGTNPLCQNDQPLCNLEETGSFHQVTLTGTATAGSATLANSANTVVYVPNPN